MAGTTSLLSAPDAQAGLRSTLDGRSDRAGGVGTGGVVERSKRRPLDDARRVRHLRPQHPVGDDRRTEVRSGRPETRRADGHRAHQLPDVGHVWRASQPDAVLALRGSRPLRIHAVG